MEERGEVRTEDQTWLLWLEKWGATWDQRELFVRELENQATAGWIGLDVGGGVEG